MFKTLVLKFTLGRSQLHRSLKLYFRVKLNFSVELSCLNFSVKNFSVKLYCGEEPAALQCSTLLYFAFHCMCLPYLKVLMFLHKQMLWTAHPSTTLPGGTCYLVGFPNSLHKRGREPDYLLSHLTTFLDALASLKPVLFTE